MAGRADEPRPEARWDDGDLAEREPVRAGDVKVAVDAPGARRAGAPQTGVGDGGARTGTRPAGDGSDGAASVPRAERRPRSAGHAAACPAAGDGRRRRPGGPAEPDGVAGDRRSDGRLAGRRFPCDEVGNPGRRRRGVPGAGHLGRGRWRKRAGGFVRADRCGRRLACAAAWAGRSGAGAAPPLGRSGRSMVHGPGRPPAWAAMAWAGCARSSGSAGGRRPCHRPGPRLRRRVSRITGV